MTSISDYVEEIDTAYNEARKRGFSTTNRCTSIDFVLELATRLKIAEITAEQLKEQNK